MRQLLPSVQSIRIRGLHRSLKKLRRHRNFLCGRLSPIGQLPSESETVLIIPSGLFEASSGEDASIAAGSNARQPLVRIAELVQLEPAPLHEAKE